MAKYSLSEKILDFLPYLNERQKRIYLASESKQLGHGGIGIVSDISGINRNTITRGKVELEKGNSAEDSEAIDTTRIRRPGAGRKSIEVTQPGIYNSLEKLVDTGSVGPLRWTTKSLRRLSSELSDEGYKVSHNKVGEMLESLGYNLQLNQKMCQDGDKNPDKDKQFEHINETCKEFNETNDPVISVACKKKDDPTKDDGISSDTAEFAVASIRSWWMSMGKERYPDSKRIYITVDAGSENKLWKVELQKFANEFGLEVTVSHFPPGTSKWNNIEHRMFAQISKDWNGRPLISLEVIVSLIASTTGLKIKCAVDENKVRENFCDSWNYTFKPQF